MSTTASDNDNKPRQQMSKIVGLTMSAARIRRWIDSQGLNFTVQREINECNEALRALEKTGAPADPGAAPKQPDPKAPAAELKKFKTAKAKWETEHKAWKEFKSKDYRKIEIVHECYKLMNKLQERLAKASPSDRIQKEIDSIKAQLADKPRPQDAKEADDVFKQRVSTFKAPGFSKVCGSTDLNNSDAIASRMTQLTEKFPELDNFLRKDSLSQQKVRFNDEGIIAIATIAENMTRELAANAIRTAANQSKKIIKPDHIIAGGEYTESPYYRLIDILSHLNALAERAQRRTKHADETKATRTMMFKKARAACTRQNKPYTSEDRPDVEALPTFEETEVENGHAVRKAVEAAGKGKNSTRTIYLWKGIDFDEDEDASDAGVNFEFYVEKLCKSIKSTEEIQSSDGDFTDGIKASKDIKKFLSDNVIDWLTRFAPKLRILIGYNGVKTIDGSTVIAALQIMLSESYLNRDGQINWNADHQALFEDINHRLALWRNHTSSSDHKSSEDED